MSGIKTDNSQRARLLFTGTGERMIENVIALITDNHEMLRCQPTETDFMRVLKHTRPHVVIVCLQTETRDMLRVYDAIYKDEKYESIPIIAIGYEDDCKQFNGRIPARHVTTLERPINREQFIEVLNNALELSQQAREEEKEQQEKKASEAKGLLGDEGLLEADKNVVSKIQRLLRLHGRKSVLVVDDDVNMLNVIKLYLQDLYDVTVVPSGKLALKYLAKKRPDMVLLDYMMPEMDGPEVLRHIRESSPNPNVPVVFLTGVSDKNSVMRGLEFHPNGYLLKPVAREALLEKVTEVVLGL